MLDKDSNGYLDADEYAGQVLGFPIPFAALDADGDGMVYAKEVGALLGQRQAVIRAQIRARAADQEDALFRALDTNGDGRLTAREIYGTPGVLNELDGNQDGQLQSHEIPGTMAVGFVRGDAQQDNALFVTPSMPAAGGGKDLPAWFVGMDSNGDGDISPREFLGARDKFRQLDADGDGFVSGDEARQYVERDTVPES
jgi:Ca2+-binding EF-hand superfamily protein